MHLMHWVALRTFFSWPTSHSCVTFLSCTWCWIMWVQAGTGLEISLLVVSRTVYFKIWKGLYSWNKLENLRFFFNQDIVCQCFFGIICLTWPLLAAAETWLYFKSAQKRHGCDGLSVSLSRVWFVSLTELNGNVLKSRKSIPNLLACFKKK